MVSGKDYVDVKIDGVRAELRAEIAELRAEIRTLGETMSARIAALPTTWTLIGTVAGGFAVSLSLLFAFLTYADGRSETARAMQMQLDKVAALAEQNSRNIERNAALIEQNSRQIAELSARIDQMLGEDRDSSSGRK